MDPGTAMGIAVSMKDSQSSPSKLSQSVFTYHDVETHPQSLQNCALNWLKTLREQLGLDKDISYLFLPY
jgi:hypothetical protein